MSDRRWGFEDLDDWEYAELDGGRSTGQQPAERAEPAETVAGQDPDEILSVHVTLEGDVASVSLITGWRQSVDPRGLGRSVLAAANAATANAMVAQIGRIEVPPPAPVAQDADRTPLTRQDVGRLLDAVTADLDHFTRQVAEVADRRVSAESGGRHVSGAAHRGQVLEVTVDPTWAARSRTSEIELEVLDVLRQLRRGSTPGELAQGPQSSAIAELNALAADPAALADRLRRGRNHWVDGGSNGT